MAKEILHSEKFHYKSYMVQNACQKAFDDMDFIADAVARAYEGGPMKSLAPGPTVSHLSAIVVAGARRSGVSDALLGLSGLETHLLLGQC